MADHRKSWYQIRRYIGLDLDPGRYIKHQQTLLKEAQYGAKQVMAAKLSMIKTFIGIK